MRISDGSRKCFFLAVNTGYATGRLPDERCERFYAERSGNGLYCAIVGNVVIPNGIAVNDVCAYISSSKRWRKLAEAIGDRGALPGIQLSSASEGFQGIKQFLPRDPCASIAGYKAALMEFSRTSVDRVFDDLRHGTQLAIAAGFRHIQLHAAHGYLFSLLIDGRFFRHADYALKRVREWAIDTTSCGEEASVRFSIATGNRELDAGQAQGPVDELMDMPFSFFDVSAGFYNISKQLIYPTSEALLSRRYEATLSLARRFPDRQIIVSGKSRAAWARGLPENVHIGICRDLIANPNFLCDGSAGCVNCMQCHYYSFGRKQIACGQWAA